MELATNMEMLDAPLLATPARAVRERSPMVTFFTLLSRRTQSPLVPVNLGFVPE
jgi:hypothetical protein